MISQIHQIDRGLSRTRLDRSRGSKILRKFRSFTPGDWSMHIKLHNALSIERGGEESQPRPRRRWQHRRRKMRRRGWLGSAAVPERERKTDKGPRGYLVGAIRLLLAEPLDLLLELPDLLLHVHGAWDCRSLSLDLRAPALSVRGARVLESWPRQLAGYFRCRGGCGSSLQCHQPSRVDRLIGTGRAGWRLTGRQPSSNLLADQPVNCEFVTG